MLKEADFILKKLGDKELWYNKKTKEFMHPSSPILFNDGPHNVICIIGGDKLIISSGRKKVIAKKLTISPNQIAFNVEFGNRLLEVKFSTYSNNPLKINGKDHPFTHSEFWLSCESLNDEYFLYNKHDLTGASAKGDPVAGSTMALVNGLTELFNGQATVALPGDSCIDSKNGVDLAGDGS